MYKYILSLSLVLFACSSAPQAEQAEVKDPPPALGQSETLSEEEAAKLLSRLTPFSQPTEAPLGFSLREGTIQKPPAIDITEQPFPPPPTTLPTRVEHTPTSVPAAPPVPVGPLLLRAFQPSGEVYSAERFVVAFSQPMTKLGSDIILTPEQTPVTMTPQPKGNWQWQDTQTLVFKPAENKPFPMATQYKVVVPAGLKSESGGVFAKETTISFSTPAPFIQSTTPYNGSVGNELSPLIYIQFNQLIEPKKVLEKLSISTKTPLRFATEKERPQDLPDFTKPTSTIILALDAPLPKATKVTLTLSAGAYSSEGPLTLKQAQRITFTTYQPLTMREKYCYLWDYESKLCQTNSPWQIYFNNNLDDKKFDASHVTVSPEVPDLLCRAYGYLSCEGSFAEKTTYTVTLSSKLTDTYGQTLAQNKTVTFKTAAKDPYADTEPRALNGPSKEFITLDPSAKPLVTIRSLGFKGLKVDMYRASPSDYALHNNRKYNYANLKDPTTPPGVLAHTEKITITKKKEEVTSTIDLTPALKDGVGQILVVVTPTDPPIKNYYGELYQYHTSFWVQSTKLGFDTFSDDEELFVFAQDLVTGRAVTDATVLIPSSQMKVLTDSEGMARLELPSTYSHSLVVSKGEDVAFYPDHTHAKRAPSEQLQWFLFDDRGLYRPGEEIHIKGWLRKSTTGKKGDLVGIPPYRMMYYKFLDSRGNEVKKGEAKINANGGFDFAVETTATMNLGTCSIQLSTGLFHQVTYNQSVRVEEFRRPEYEVTASADKSTLFIDEEAQLSVDARYFAGGGLANAPVTWDVSVSEANFTPPNRSDFTFGQQYSYNTGEADQWKLPEAKDLIIDATPGETVTKGTEGITGASGIHAIKIKTKAASIPRPYSITAQATVRDLNNQSWTADTSLLVHSADRYIGLRTERPFYQKDKPIIVESILADLDGNAVAEQSIALSIARITTEYDPKKGRVFLRDDESAITLTSTSQVIEHVFTPKRTGHYQITASAIDSAERPTRTTFDLYVNGYDDDDRSIDSGKLVLSTNKKEYKPGETALINVSSQLFPAEGLLVINNGGIVSHKRFTQQSETAEVKLLMEETYSPTASITALVVGAKRRRNEAASQDANLPPQPAFALGEASVSVPRLSRTLTVKATPKSPEATPGQETEIEVLVKDHKGKVVQDAEVVLVVVDESVLALSGYQIPSPMSFFYPPKGKQQTMFHFRSMIDLAKDKDLKEGEKSAKELEEEAKSAGMLYTMKSPSPDPENILGGLLGDRPGEAEGGFGLGLRGTGIGGGGTGEGTIGLGNENTIGKGGGGGSGSGIGRGGAGFGGRTAGGPEVTDGKAEINGSLDKDIVRRVIRRAMPGIKFCYEQALAANPGLGGKIKISFTINSDGSVSSSSPVSGIDSEVDACVAKKIGQLSFPAPEGGGVVEVTYPFLFQSDGVADGNNNNSGADEADSGTPVTMRTNLQPLALFSANNFTNKQGKVKIKFTLPDNLTRYRITAVAAETLRFGSSESSLTATKKLMVRPSFPRFLNLSDQAIVPVLLQNNTSKPIVAKIAMRTQGCELDGPSGYIANIPPDERVELRFPIKATAIGACKAQLISASGKLSDAQEVTLPVYTPATSEAQAIYGVIDAGATAQPIQLPENAFSSFGGVTVTTSSTAVTALTDSMMYLYRYPYECAEQISSKVLGIIAMRDVLAAFQSDELPAGKKIDSFINYELKRLREKQNNDGGFGFWSSKDDSWPYLSVHVAHVVARAKAKGYQPPDKLVNGLKRYLPTMEYLSRREYSQGTRDSLLAYSLFVRRLLDDPQPAKARALLQKRGVDKLPLESLGWLLMVIYDDPESSKEIEQIKTLLQNQIETTASEAHFTTDYGFEYGYLVLASDHRTDAVLLEALIKADPESVLIPKLVRGLRTSQRYGHWGNTQNNLFVMLALDAYFNEYEKETPDFKVNLWFGERYAGEQSFKGRSTDQQQLFIPMSFVAQQSGGNLILSKEGAGRLYYRVGMRYAPKDFMLEALNAGFVVKRSYEGLDSKDDVTQDKDGVWHIKAGARIKVTLTMEAKGIRYHVALVDPLPAGFEAQNEGFATTRDKTEESAPGLGGYGFGEYGGIGRGSYNWRWGGRWYEHANKRDERVEAFTSVLYPGTHVYSYTALATTPGTFLAAPTKAEEMYTPETFGRSKTEVVIIEATPNKL